MTTSKNKYARARKLLHDWLPSIVLLCLILVARSTLADHYHVPSGSMEHALVPGDHVVVNKAAYGFRLPFTKQVLMGESQPARGEVVIFDSPVDGTRLIKRVVALGGDLVSVRSGRVQVNGRFLHLPGNSEVEQYGPRLVKLNLDHGGGPDLETFRVPTGQVLVLGDHRGRSNDGRYFGTVEMSELYGRASGVFWRRSEGPLWSPL